MRHTLAQQATTAVAVGCARVGVQMGSRASPRVMHDVRSKTDVILNQDDRIPRQSVNGRFDFRIIGYYYWRSW